MRWIKHPRFRVYVALLVALGPWLYLGFTNYDEFCHKNEYSSQKDCPTYYSAFVVALNIGKFLDDHNGLLVALFTGLLWWVSRGQYKILKASTDTADETAKAAKKSADTTERQGNDFRAIQSARLIVEFSPEITEDAEDIFVRGVYMIKNVGGTVAANIRIQDQHGWSAAAPDYPKIPSTPGSEGSNLVVGGFIERPVGWQIPKWQLENGYVSSMIWISYRDIFGEAKITQICYLYDARSKKFFPY